MRVVNHVNSFAIILFVPCQFVSFAPLIMSLLGTISRVIVRRLFRRHITLATSRPDSKHDFTSLGKWRLE